MKKQPSDSILYKYINFKLQTMGLQHSNRFIINQVMHLLINQELQLLSNSFIKSNLFQIDSSMSNSFDYLFKFILIGDSSVGKSCLLNRFVEGKFKNEHDPTLGVQFGCKNITIDGIALKIQIWDTAGQQSFKSITRSYYKGSVAAFLVFDITRRSSFDNINKWLYEIKNYSHESIHIVLIGNKSDLGQNRQISTQEATKYAKENKYEYYETSALTGVNVNLPFEEVSKKILSKIQRKEVDPESQNSFGIKVGRKRKQHKNDSRPIQISKQTGWQSHNENKSCRC